MVNKRNIAQVALWCYSFSVAGAVVSVIGPTLPDLQHMYKASLAAISNLFLIMGLALNIGNLLFVYMAEFLHPNIILLACSLLGSASTPFLGVTPNMYVAFFAVAIDGATMSCLLNCILHQCNRTFPGLSSLTHLLLVTSSLGSAAAPVLAKPFLQRTVSQQLSLNLSILNGTPANVSLKNSLVLPMPKEVYTTINTSDIQYTSTKESNVHIIYIFLSLLFLLSAFGYGLLFMLERCSNVKPSSKEDTTKEYTDLGESVKNRRCFYIGFLFLLVTTSFIFTGIPYAYGEFLTTYGVEGSSHVSVQSMAVMVSVYWLFFSLGRIMGTCLSVFIEQSVLIFMCILGVVVSPVVMSFAAPLGQLGMWVGSMSLALFSGPLVAAMLNWCGSCIPLSPLVIGINSAGDLSGMAVIPYLAGQIVGYFGISSFMCFIAALAVCQLPMFVALYIVGSWIRQQR